MPAIKLPQQNQWMGIFPGKYKGELWQTYNIDLEKSPGRIVLSDKFRILADTGDLTSMVTTVKKFVLTNADSSSTYRWWALGSGALYKSASSTGQGWTSDSATSNSPTTGNDMIIFGSANGSQRLMVSQDTDMAVLNRDSNTVNTWGPAFWVTTLGQTGLDSDVYHFLGKLNTLSIVHDQDTNGYSVIHTIDQSNVVVRNRLRFQVGMEMRGSITIGRYIWIGLQNNSGGNGAIVPWDGFSESYEDGNFVIAGSYPMVLFQVRGVPYVITEKGYIQKYTGDGFTTVNEFPIVEEKLTFSISRRPFADDQGINPYGAEVIGENLVKILVSASQLSRRMRSGIWHYNVATNNLYHYAGVGRHKTAGTDVGYGGITATPGGIAALSPDDTGGELLIGANPFTTQSVSGPVIGQMVFNANSASNGGRNRGYFITTYLKGPDINEFWNGLWVRYRRFISNGNLIRVFFRTRDPKRDVDDGDDSVLQVTGTWVSTTTFTAPVPTGVVVGESIEVLSGDNSGSVYPISVMTDTNIAAVTPNGSTSVIVTINDTAITSSTATFHARFDNFRLAGTISDTASDGEFAAIPGGDSDENNLNLSDEVQFLVELRGFSQEIKNLLPVYTPGRRIEP